MERKVGKKTWILRESKKELERVLDIYMNPKYT